MAAEMLLICFKTQIIITGMNKMKFNKFALLFLLIFMSGCFTSMPVINESFLQNKSSDDLNKIKKKIIAKNNEIEAQKKEIEVTDQKFVVIKKKIDYLEAEKPMLDEYIKLYIILADNEKLASTRAALKKNKDETEFQEKNKKYHDLKKEYQERQLEEKQAQMDVLAAELELEKAYILKLPAESDETTPEKVKKEKELLYKNTSCKLLSKGASVNVCSIIEIHSDRNKKLKDITARKNKAKKEFIKSEEEIKATGKSLDF
jgi:hypothetical protein